MTDHVSKFRGRIRTSAPLNRRVTEGRTRKSNVELDQFRCFVQCSKRHERIRREDIVSCRGLSWGSLRKRKDDMQIIGGFAINQNSRARQAFILLQRKAICFGSTNQRAIINFRLNPSPQRLSRYIMRREQMAMERPKSTSTRYRAEAAEQGLECGATCKRFENRGKKSVKC